MERLFVIKSHISPLILVLPSPHACVIQINRPSARNAFNFEIIENVIRHVSMARSAGKPVVITGIPKRFFGSGGDLKLVTSKILKIPEFLRSLHHMFYLVSLVKNSVSLWTGHVIGSGAGLACSCKVRVAFPSTLYSMPENMLGLFPDVGASYFLTHYVQEKSIGLYISLTGVVLDGYDCYVLGLCNYFIEEEDYEKVLSGNAEVLEKNHKEIEKGMRYLEKSKVWKKKKIIEECFGNCQSVNEVFERLLRNNTQWARDVLELLKQACPLSLKVAFRAFQVGSQMTLKECLEMEFNIENSMMLYFRYNFLHGVTSKLRKDPNRKWIPSTLEEVSEEMISTLFENPHGLRLDLSFLH